jgi:hypothetical protein
LISFLVYLYLQQLLSIAIKASKRVLTLTLDVLSNIVIAKVSGVVFL